MDGHDTYRFTTISTTRGEYLMPGDFVTVPTTGDNTLWKVQTVERVFDTGATVVRVRSVRHFHGDTLTIGADVPVTLWTIAPVFVLDEVAE